MQNGELHELVITPVYVRSATGLGLLNVVVTGFSVDDSAGSSRPRRSSVYGPARSNQPNFFQANAVRAKLVRTSSLHSGSKSSKGFHDGEPLENSRFEFCF